MSYLEIYNEKVRDLLNPSEKKALKVREHASLGPYVDGLVKTIVSTSTEINEIIEEGGKSRTIASTNMNSESSRSHSVFTVNIVQEEKSGALVGEKVSRLSLVDLAGSERASKTGAAGDRLKGRDLKTTTFLKKWYKNFLKNCLKDFIKKCVNFVLKNCLKNFLKIVLKFF